LLKKAGITGWQVNKTVRLGQLSREVDFLFARYRIAIEIDGWAWHHTPSRFQQDRTKQNALVRNGWQVYRFTWFDLTQRPAAVIAEVRHALAMAA
jgi:very-short-patch-repair endonuclease